MNLYNATHLATLDAHTDPETGEIDLLAYDNAQIALADKQQAVVAYVKNLDVNRKAVKAVIDELKVRLQAIDKKDERLREYLIANMKQAGISKIEAPTFTATLSIDRDESLIIDDGATFDPSLCLDPKPPAPSKTLIKAAIERGEPIDGARIVRNDRLTIK